MRRMFIWPLAFAFACLAAQVSSAGTVLAAGDQSGVMRVLGRFVTAINAGDIKAASAAAAPSVDVVDDFAPHHWTGPDALAAWAAGFAQSLKAAKITDPSIAISASPRTQIDGGHAFAPVPTVYRYRQNGKAIKETGILVFELDRIRGAWKIASMSWAPAP